MPSIRHLKMNFDNVTLVTYIPKKHNSAKTGKILSQNLTPNQKKSKKFTFTFSLNHWSLWFT